MMIPRTLNMAEIDDDEIIVDEHHGKTSKFPSVTLTSNKEILTTNDKSGAHYNSQLKTSQIDDDDRIVDTHLDKPSESLSAALTSNKESLTTNDMNVAAYNSQHSVIVNRNLISNSPGVIPTEKDVLCGRGKAFFNHEGNKKFREIVGNTIGIYLRANRKSEKSKIVIAIADEVMRTGARFLKRKGKGKDWYEGGFNLARQKIGHAIRDANTNKSQAIFHIYSRQRQQIGGEIDSAAFNSNCSLDDSPKSDTQHGKVQDPPRFDSNSIQQDTFDERGMGGHALMNHFYFRSTEQMTMDTLESSRLNMPEKNSRSSSTSSLDSTYIDVLNDLSCEDLDFFLDAL